MRKVIRKQRLRASKIRVQRVLYKREINESLSISERQILLSYYKNALLRNPTNAEMEMVCILESHKVQYKFQKQFGSYIVDFYLPQYRLVIEVDGEQHRSNAQQVLYDKRRTRYLEDRRYLSVIRFTNEDVLNKANEVKKVLSERLFEGHVGGFSERRR